MMARAPLAANQIGMPLAFTAPFQMSAIDIGAETSMAAAIIA